MSNGKFGASTIATKRPNTKTGLFGAASCLVLMALPDPAQAAVLTIGSKNVQSDFQGFGVNLKNNQTSSADWNTAIATRLREVKPRQIRLSLSLGAFAPDAATRHWDSAELQNAYAIMDVAKELGSGAGTLRLRRPSSLPPLTKSSQPPTSTFKRTPLASQNCRTSISRSSDTFGALPRTPLEVGSRSCSWRGKRSAVRPPSPLSTTA